MARSSGYTSPVPSPAIWLAPRFQEPHRVQGTGSEASAGYHRLLDHRSLRSGSTRTWHQRAEEAAHLGGNHARGWWSSAIITNHTASILDNADALTATTAARPTTSRRRHSGAPSFDGYRAYAGGDTFPASSNPATLVPLPRLSALQVDRRLVPPGSTTRRCITKPRQTPPSPARTASTAGLLRPRRPVHRAARGRQ